MNLAYVVECYDTFIVDEILTLRRDGIGVTVLDAFRPVPEQDPVKEEVRRGALYFPTGYRRVPAANIRVFLRHPVAYLGALVRLLRIGESLRMLALGAYYASVVKRHRIDHVHATFGTRTATLAYVIARLSGTPFSFTTHAYDIFKPNPTFGWKSRRAAFVRTISEFNRRFIASTYPDADLSKVIVKYLGVDLGVFKPIPPSASDRLRLLTVGRLVATKGHDVLVAACDRLVRAGCAISCRIVGSGDRDEYLRNEIERRGVQGVVDLSGPLSHDAVRHVIGDTDVFVLACRQAKDSADQDGIPVALMEAMAMGVPVVSTSISGVPELIEDGVSGLLVPSDDEDALARAIESLARDVSLRERLGAGARRRIQERFDLIANTRRFYALFESTTPRRRGASRPVADAAMSSVHGH